MAPHMRPWQDKKMSLPGGDWMCAACQHQNFKKREACQRCGYPKYGGPDVSTYLCNRTEVLAGDWYCTAMNCGAHNYASRPNCYRCGAAKTDYACANMMAYGTDGSVPPGWKSEWDVEFTIMLAGWCATNAKHQGNKTLCFLAPHEKSSSYLHLCVSTPR
ncbi:hypothetical protein CUMW_127740, partial [Citrus unshiu]